MLERIDLGCDKDGPLDGVANAISPYTNQEIKVAELSAEGSSDQEIAEILRISPQHVCELREAILIKAKAVMRGR